MAFTLTHQISKPMGDFRLKYYTALCITIIKTPTEEIFLEEQVLHALQ